MSCRKVGRKDLMHLPYCNAVVSQNTKGRDNGELEWSKKRYNDKGWLMETKARMWAAEAEQKG